MQLDGALPYGPAVMKGNRDIAAPPADKERHLPLRRVAVTELLAGAREAVLLHDGTEYRLRLTSNGKLILTK